MSKTPAITRSILWGALTLIVVRLLTLAYPDLVDTTEGRYAGVAQLMLHRDDWVTPWINFHGVDKPYLGKPPLHFWLVQISFLLFGENAFAARFPSFLSAVGIGVALWITTRALLGLEAAMVAVLVLGSSCMLFFLGGAVVLDVTLTLGISIALLAFLLSERSRLAGWLFFAGLGLGVLVKGPLAGVLAGCTIAPWALLQRYSSGSWPAQLRKLPWVTGCGLFLAIVLPWYVWAEVRNPGFLKYFLWNENFGRYLKKDYGDVYGSGHRQPFGAAWGMMFLGTVPWSVALSALLLMRPKKFFSKNTVVAIKNDSLLLYGLCWALSCPVLLLGAKQYTATYLMPSIPGFAFLLAICWERGYSRGWVSDTLVARVLKVIGLILALLAIIGAIISLWYSVSLLYALMTFGAALLTCIGIIRNHGASAASHVLRVAVITAFVYGAASMCFNSHLSSNRSTQEALKLVRTVIPPGTPVRLGLPYYVPFSAFFYSRAQGDAQLELVPLNEETVKTTAVDLFLVRQRNVNRLREALPNVQEVESIGQWRIMRNG